MNKTRKLLLALIVVMTAIRLFDGSARAAAKPNGKKKVLVVMSYHQGYEGEIEIARGLEQNLSGVEFRYFYLDAKYDYQRGEQMGAKAYRVFRDYRPDAVVAVDDPAQHFFVVPYLRGKVEVPVIFCGVNYEAGKYGYPAKNVTGVLEKKHYRESLGFARVVVPSLRRVAVVYLDNETNRQNLAQIEAEEDDYPLEITGKHRVETLAELRGIVARLGNQVDGVMLLNLSGILDSKGSAVDGPEAIRLLIDSCRLPTIGATSWEIRAGILCGVIESDIEQGSISAALLTKIWAGAKVADLPITQNCNGRRLVNLTTLKKLKLTLTPEAVLGTEMVETGRF